MDRLIADLQKTIQALETISTTKPALAEQSDELLDQLFQQKIDLVAASLNAEAPSYQQALQAISSAAGKVEKLAKNPTDAAETFKSVENAIAKLARLLDQLVHTQ